MESELGVQLGVRIGVHTDLIVVRESIKHQQEQQVSLGQLPEVAVQLRSLAQWNEVVISSATNKRIRKFFQVRDLGEVSGAMSPSPPLRAMHVVEELEEDRRFEADGPGGLTAMIGRGWELQQLENCWAEARRESGQVALIVSEAGFGKSRLLAEVKRRIAMECTNIVECRCSPYHQNSSLFPIIRTIEHWLGFDREDYSNTEKLDRLERAVATYESLPPDMLPVFANLLSVPFDGRYAPLEVSPKKEKELTFEAITTLLIENALISPMLFIVEDLHWVDSSTQEWLSLVMEQTPTIPVFAVFSTRPEYSPPAMWQSFDHFNPIHLKQFDRREAHQMVSEITHGRDVPPQVFQEIWKKTEGCPLFIEDWTRMILESGLLEEKDGAWVLSQPFQPLAIPETPQETLMMRLDRLGEACSVAQAASAIGRSFSIELLGDIVDLDEDTLKEELEKLVSTRLASRRGLFKKASFVFKHALIQEALHESLLKKERREYHRRIAQALEDRFQHVCETQPELLAFHFSEAGALERSIHYWVLACEQAARKSANVDLLGHAACALTAIEDLPDSKERDHCELRIRVVQGASLLAVKGWASSEISSNFQRAMELCEHLGDDRVLFRITRGLWSYLMVSAQIERSVEVAHQVLEIATKEGSPDFDIEAQTALCDSYFWLGRPAEANHHAKRCLAIYDFQEHHESHSQEHGEDPAAICLCYSTLSLWFLGYYEQAKISAQYTESNIERYSHPFSKGFLLHALAWYGVHTRDVQQAESYGQRLKDLAIEHDFAPWLALSKTQIGWARAVQGQIEDGVAQLLSGVAELNAAGIRIALCFHHALLGEIFHRAQRWEDGLKWISRGLATAETTEDRHFLSELHRWKGAFLLQFDASLDDVEANLVTAYEIAADQKAKAFELRAAMDLYTLRTLQNRESEGRRVLQSVCQGFSESEDNPELLVANQRLLSQGDLS